MSRTGNVSIDMTIIIWFLRNDPDFSFWIYDLKLQWSSHFFTDMMFNLIVGVYKELQLSENLFFFAQLKYASIHIRNIQWNI
jgi:hypothetical protein